MYNTEYHEDALQIVVGQKCINASAILQNNKNTIQLTTCVDTHKCEILQNLARST